VLQRLLDCEIFILLTHDSMHKQILKLFVILLFALLVLYAVNGIVHDLSMPRHSEDFQWSPSKIFWSGRNPYKLWLSGNPTGEMILSQQPNYLPLLYVLLFPFAHLDFSTAKLAWAATNFAFLAFTYAMASRLFDLRGTRRLVGLALFLASRPTIHVFENGQHSLLILAAFVASIYVSRREGNRTLETGVPTRKRLGVSALLAGFTYAKYSFAPSLASAYLLRHGWRYLLVTMIPAVAALAFSWIWIGSDVSLTEFVMLPLKVASTYRLSPGAGDLLTVLQNTIAESGWSRILAMVCCFLLAIAVPAFSGHKAGSMEFWSFASVASLTFVTHLRYDYVFYLFPALLALRRINTSAGVLLAGLVAFQWWNWQSLIGLSIDKTTIAGIGFLVNMFLLSVIKSMRSSTSCGPYNPPSHRAV
jgi:hypothetical protein